VKGLGLIEKDHINQPVAPTIILGNKSGKRIGSLIIDYTTLTIKLFLDNNYIFSSELSCDVNKYINGQKNLLWDEITNFKMLYIPIEVPYFKARGLWYEITVTIDDYNNTVKHITGTLAQYAELEQCVNYEVEIRTEEDIDRDDYIDTVFYNPDDVKGSIVHRIINDKAKHYSIAHVDESLWNIKRTFSFDGKSIIDCLKELAEQVDCLIMFGESNTKDTQLHRTISFYDGKDYCPECGKRGDFTDGCTNPECTHSQKIIPRYGKDTGLFINKENLGDNINLSMEVDNIKNCYRMSAGDDDMTATVINCNPSGSRYIWHFTSDMKKDMSAELREKIEEYESLYEEIKHNIEITAISADTIANYNQLATKYTRYSSEELPTISYPITGYLKLTEAYYNITYMDDFLNVIMMPYSPDVEDTTAQEQIDLFTQRTIGVKGLTAITATTAVTNIKDAVNIVIDTSRYSTTVVTSSYSAPNWTGTITVTSLTDEEDTATISPTITFSEATNDYIKQRIESLLNKKKTIVSGIKSLLELSSEDFENEVKKYCLNSLSNIASVIDAVLNILIEAGITPTSSPDVYRQIYEPYEAKKDIIANEIRVREAETAFTHNLIEEVDEIQKNIHDSLDLETYLGETLWLELMAFKREDEFEDSNIISDGLTIHEMIENAMEFYDRASQDIQKQAESQLNIQCTLKNLLLLTPEVYNPFSQVFDLCNWMRIEVDEKLYKLRLISYQINYADLSNIQIEFSDCRKTNDIYSRFNEYRNSTNSNTKNITSVIQQVNTITTEVTDTASLFKQTDGVLTLSVANIYVESGEVPLEEYLKDIQVDLAIDLDSARQQATNYISADNTGLMIANMEGNVKYLPDEVGVGITNTFINDTSFNVRNGKTILASFGSSELWLGDRNNFSVDSNGYLTANNVQINGSINAITGNIGGFIVSSDANTDTSENDGHAYGKSLYIHSSDINDNYEYEAGLKGSGGTGASDYLAFYVKRIISGETWDTAENMFYVLNNGSLYARNAEISGKITASSGAIGPFVITTTSNGDTSINDGHFGTNALYIHASQNDYEYETGIKGNLGAGTTSFYVRRIPSGARWDSSDGEYIYYVTNMGKLFANDANIRGSIKATSFTAYGTNSLTYTTIGDNISLINTNSLIEPYFYIKNSSGTSARTMKLTADTLNLNGGTIYNSATGIDFNRTVFVPNLILGTNSVIKLTVGTTTMPFFSNYANSIYFGVPAEYEQTISTTYIRGAIVRLYTTDSTNGGVYLGSSGSIAITSDETLKDLYYINDKYVDFFNKLDPIAYKYKIGHRMHLGFGAQSVEKALLNSGLTTEEFAGIVISEDVDIGEDERMSPTGEKHFDKIYSLRYEEFIALNTMMIQKLQKKINILESKIKRITG